MIPSESLTETAQNIHFTQSCAKGSDCQTGHNLKGRIFKSILPVERSPINTPIDTQERTPISAGGCRFIHGPVGSYRCECINPHHCFKAQASARLTLTLRCFLYHDRHVQVRA
jgi:hypothetical protein